MFTTMKKMTFLACAILLTSVVGFTGCKPQNVEEPQQKAPAVTTDIAISLPAQVGGPRRMPGQTVQTAGATDFATNGMTNIVLIPFAASAKVTSSSVRYGENISLGDLTAANSASKVGGHAKVYSDKQVPQGTSAFLFYGKSGATNANLFSCGALAGSITGEPSTFSFSLQPICDGTAVGNITTDAALFNAYLNLVAGAQDANGVAWKDYTTGLNQGYYDLFQSYKDLTTLSTFGVERMMTDLYNSLSLNVDSLAKAIRKAILDPTYASLDGSGNVKLVSGMQNFPRKYNIPEGAVSVAFAEGSFGNNAAHSFGSLAPAGLGNYVYPAALWYFANTKIKTSASSQAAAYVNNASWKSILEGYEKDDASVSSSTRSIALKDTIQYAVARLDVRVKAADGGTLNDNNPVASQQAVSVPVGGYPLKAVLVGNQKNVGFDFAPLSGSSVYTIYDTLLTANIAAAPSASDYSAANSTLVLETATDDGANGSDVFIALEFVNTGSDFYGLGGQIVPAGARFYLVGQLAAASATETGGKVFKQDYTTTARFNIKNLTKAYSTIPDLKAPQLEIGMSVDLSWESGHTYDIDLE